MFASAYILFALATYSHYRDSETPTVKTFSICMSLAGFWPLLYGLELMFTDESTIRIIANIKNITPQFFTPAWLTFNYLMVKQERPPKKLMYILYTLSTISIIMILTNDFHYLYKTKGLINTPQELDRITLLITEHGMFTKYLNLPFHYLTNLYIVGFVIKGIISHKPPYRYQFTMVAFASAMVISLSLAYSITPDTFSYISPTPIAMGVLGMIVLVSIFKYSLLDLAPYARDKVFQVIQSPVIVIDKNRRIADMNTSAEKTLPNIEIGLNAIDFFHEIGVDWFGIDKAKTFEIKTDDDARYFNIIKQRISSHENSFVIIFSDVTDSIRLINSKHDKEIVQYKESILGDMHDGIGGVLATAAVLSQAAKQTEEKGERDQYLSKLSAILEDGSFELRSMLNILDKEEIDTISLIGDMRTFASTVMEAKGIDLRFKQDISFEEHDIDFDKYLSIFRTFKEAVTNVLKHSAAEKCEINVKVDSNNITIKVKDNGQWRGEDKKSGFGLNNMLRRVENMNGIFKIDKENGTVVEMIIPIGRVN